MDNAKQYRVMWEIDIWSDSPEGAARAARKIQLDPENTATVYDTADRETGETKRVDLLEEEGFNWSCPRCGEDNYTEAPGDIMQCSWCEFEVPKSQVQNLDRK